ncbi:flavohemoglobin expression-modulating QEGLA motif protein [Luteimonas sp. e5]
MSADTSPTTLAPSFEPGKAWRRRLQHGGRVHLDRALPFVVLAHHGGEAFSLARRVASISAASVIWPRAGGDKADAEAEALLTQLRSMLADEFPRLLLIDLHDLPRDASLDEESPRLEPFRFTLAHSDDAAAEAAAADLREALDELCIDLREADIDDAELDASSPWLQQLGEDDSACISRISLGIPQIHRIPGHGDRQLYPMIYQQMERSVFDALLRAVAAFVGAQDEGDDSAEAAASHHRAYGRSHFLRAALRADKALAGISASFDFLLALSPINTMQAFEQFESGGRKQMPDFHYRPLSVSPDLLKRRLYRINLRAVEDPVLETLFREKREELDQQLMMLQRRNEPGFRELSVLQYGGVEHGLLEQAQVILDKVPAKACDAPRIGAEQVLAGARKMIARYHEATPAFASAEACLRADIGPGMMVSGDELLISEATRMSSARLDALLQHEISVHLLTYINGSQQGLGIFAAGLADYEGIQEGLGVFAEFAVGGLNAARLRLLAARVLIVDAMLSGADFVECHRLLRSTHGFSSRAAFNICARIFRSGGLSKDAIYLRGFQEVLDWVAAGKSLDPFWHGKFAARHVPVVEELRLRGMLRPPCVTPEFLERPIARATLARLRAGEHFVDLLRSPPT